MKKETADDRPIWRLSALALVGLSYLSACELLAPPEKPDPQLWYQISDVMPADDDFEAPVDLTRIQHLHDPETDPDVPLYTDVTLDTEIPDFVDSDGAAYARLTLYNIDPPLEDFPSKEEGVDRGLDFRDPSNLVKSAYSNYVSPVFTAGGRRRPVPGHPIGHFLVKLELPGHPTLLTGMTTTARGDTELVELTLGQQLGIGGVLLTPQPGRLNSAAEAQHELSLRQEPLEVVDGVNYRPGVLRRGGPTLDVDDGNVTFVRFKIPIENANDGLKFFHEYVRRGVHNIFGSLVNRPHKATGAGCATFAMAWLKATGIIPVIEEGDIDAFLEEARERGEPRPYWASFRRKVWLPWAHVGCDERVGARDAFPADYTIYDLLFHDLAKRDVIGASPGLARQIKRDYGIFVGTLFQFGALTPLRDILIGSKRKDPKDVGAYDWATPGTGIPIAVWENDLFSDWVKTQWAVPKESSKMSLVREGRFRGVEIDALDTPRQARAFFARADQIARARRAAPHGRTPFGSCEAVFISGLQ